MWLNKLAESNCKVLLKAHILTGSNITSKIGTKTTALKNNPDELINFGEAEKYLINVLYLKENCTTFDKLCYVLYTGKNKSITELPSTSKSLYGHLQRCHYFIKLCSNLFNSHRKNMNPISYGWISNNASPR